MSDIHYGSPHHRGAQSATQVYQRVPGNGRLVPASALSGPYEARAPIQPEDRSVRPCALRPAECIHPFSTITGRASGKRKISVV